MRTRFTVGVVLAVAIVGIALPVLAALYIAHRQSMDAEMEHADSMAREILRRADDAGRQSLDAWQRLQDAPQPLDCSEESLGLMREIVMQSTYLQTIGFVVDGRLMCSSLGDHGDGIELGPVDYVSVLGTQVRTTAGVGFGGSGSFLVLQRGNVAGVIHPDELIDAFVNRADVALGVYGRSSGVRMASRGDFNPRWSARMGEADQKVFFDGRHLVSMQRSNNFDVVAYVAVPVAYLRARLWSFIAVLVPMALLLAAALSFGIIWLARQRTSMRAALRLALKRGEFEVHYQPIIELESSRIVGVEALLRWPARSGSVLRPDLFIPVAEECGLLPQITRYVIARVAEDMPRVLREYPACYVSINLGASDLHSHAIVATLRELVGTRGFAAHNIIIEATEHSLLDPELAQRVVSEIRELGIQVAIDDFGTGYSGLSQLTSMQSDYLKIDKVFVETIGTDSPTSHVAVHIIRIAQSLGLRVIAEGVETKVQADLLMQHGVTLAQGWLFHRAMTVNALLDELRNPTPRSASSA